MKRGGDQSDVEEAVFVRAQGCQTDGHWLFQKLEEVEDPFSPGPTHPPVPTEAADLFTFADPVAPPVREDSKPLIDYLTRVPMEVAEMEQPPSMPQAQYLLGSRASPKPSPLYFMDHDWVIMYQRCPKWKESWDQVHQPEGQWPLWYQLREGKLYHRNKICVPSGLGIKIVAAHHQKNGHSGVKRLLEEVRSGYWFGEERPLPWLVAQVKKHCVVCQAVEHPNWLGKDQLGMTALPTRSMSHVCIDVFTLPPTQWQGVEYDCMIVCVDRLSGWIVAIPTTKLGLTGEKAADLLLDKVWYVFGVPTVVSSDQGFQFMSRW